MGMGIKVAVAVSGGIDSLVAAFLLKSQGFDIIGLHFVTGFEDIPAMNYGDGHITFFPDSCTKDNDSAQIRHISSSLGIPVHLIDIRKEFREWVSDYFFRSYLKGLTPNPCIACNARIKFGLMLEKAVFLGAEFLATGHYAKTWAANDGKTRLFMSADKAKDQSYFLSQVRNDALEKCLFPLSEFTKEEVRLLALKNGLRAPVSKESQDICFIKGGYADFMESQPGFSVRHGDIVTPEGKKVGVHQGLHLYTIGQRRGINCPAKEPYYVLKLDTDNNTLVVGSKCELYRDACIVDSMNWFDDEGFDEKRLKVKIRYAHRPADAKVRRHDANTCEVLFDEPQLSVTPGQAAVFYDNEEVIGGGIIRRY